MPLRRTLATTAAAVTLAVLLSSCGFNLSTDRVNDNTAGGQDRSGVVDVLAAVVVSSQAGEGTFIASLSNNDQEAAHALVSVEGVTGGTGGTPEAADVEKLTIPPGGFVNLADGEGIKLTGDFDAGDVVRLAVGFDNAQTTTLDVPVVRACEEYAGLDPAVTESSTPSADPTDAPETVDPSGAASARTTGPAGDGASDAASDAASDESSPTASARASRTSSPSATPSAYACGYASIGSLPANEQKSE